ncbi:hypothetical protein QUV83_06095 [Cellulomonas cellasea]|uniref:hypothetical protein n=1 Tax=Cellulomonas cellasea TaxID=43670 RepID=UPI0025A436D1|nr:hypothetical protein [Cellulomonas cellasea]MDM8084330.1 hypothetical protein [Cellulomonas cellasea]
MHGIEGGDDLGLTFTGLTFTGMAESLARIDAGLRELRRDALLELLMPAVEPSRTRAVLTAHGLPSRAAVEALYGWRGGTGPGDARLGDISMLPGFYLLTLDDALANYEAFLPDARWAPGWLPLFANGGGDFYVADLGGEMAGSVRHFRIDESEHPVDFLTLADMARTMAAAFDRGVFFVDSHGHLEMNDLDFAAVAAELNPRVPWWVD